MLREGNARNAELRRVHLYPCGVAVIVVVLLADANKRSPESIRYWFHVLDLNGAERVDRSCIYEFYLSQVVDREWLEG